MSRISIPKSIEESLVPSRPFLEAVKKQLGSVPNLFRLIGTSTPSLEGFLGLSGSLGKGELPAATRERIALAVAEVNGCGYCLSAHTFIGKNMLKLSEEELRLNRKGLSTDAKAQAAVTFAAKVTSARGHVSAEDLSAVKAAGYSDAQIVEIVTHVALNTLTNYMNEVAKTEIDFPVVEPGSFS